MHVYTNIRRDISRNAEWLSTVVPKTGSLTEIMPQYLRSYVADMRFWISDEAVDL